MQTLQDLVNTAIQSEAPHQPQLVISPNWLTGAGTDPQEVWRALQSLGMLLSYLLPVTSVCSHNFKPIHAFDAEGHQPLHGEKYKSWLGRAPA